MAKHRVNPLEENNRGYVTARVRYGELKVEDGVRPPEDRSQPQACGDYGEWDTQSTSDPSFNDVSIKAWTRGGKQMPNFDSRDPKSGMPKKW